MSRIHDALRRGAPSPVPAPPERRPDGATVVPERLVEAASVPAERPPDVARPPKVDTARRAAQADAVLRTLGYTPVGGATRHRGLLVLLVMVAMLALLAWLGLKFIR